ncbi:hypothetical protein [Ramlibacter sp.]|uniref:hypothetical protein n=1 Tax=Ramlibacter sp. TaxID=1917967 RepID=UPI002C4DC66B|nr:hypothetical protein [Ramlibacter sp.]HWI81431.1 hypothetical protein [Ramlibacter sp.]
MNKLLLEGLTDAIGFLAGALLGFGVGRLAGWDVFATGYTGSSVAGILLAGLGGGAGLQLARRWRAGRRKEE